MGGGNFPAPCHQPRAEFLRDEDVVKEGLRHSDNCHYNVLITSPRTVYLPASAVSIVGLREPLSFHRCRFLMQKKSVVLPRQQYVHNRSFEKMDFEVSKLK